MSGPDTNGWSRAEKYVFEELRRLSDKVEAIDDKLSNLRVEVAQKGALWGAISGLVITAIGLLLR